MKQKVVLAYSGGLDTSVILKWLLEQNYEVICYLADVGQDDDFEAAKEKALGIGASKVYVEDLKEEFVNDYIFEALKAGAVYEGTYLLGTALARPIIAKRHVEIAQQEGTKLLAHGATGKGNDQVRFEMTYMKLMNDVEIISPWKDPVFLAEFEGREDLLTYAHKNDIPLDTTLKKPFSMDDNIMHISYESGILEDPLVQAPKTTYKKTVMPTQAPDIVTEIAIDFEQGIPVAVHNLSTEETVTGAVKLFSYLNDLAGKNGVGRIDIVENRFIGMKSRGVYETPAGTVLHLAHNDLESITVDKEVMHHKRTLIPAIAKTIYNGFWYSPEMKFFMAAINESQQHVTGTVHMSLYKGSAFVTARESEKSLYDEAIASMDVAGGYDQTDAKGFIKIQALRLKLGQ